MFERSRKTELDQQLPYLVHKKRYRKVREHYFCYPYTHIQ